MSPDKPALEVVHLTLPAHEVSNAFASADLAETAIAEVDFAAARFYIFSLEVIVAVQTTKRAFVLEMSQLCLKVVSLRAAHLRGL